jgi:WXG100 family type VII secretion target
MTADRSRADYRQLTTIAKAWQTESSNAAELLRTLQQHVERARGGAWVGKAASAFLAEMDGTVIPSLKRLIAALADASTATKQISTEFKAAEDAAANVLKEDRTTPAGQPGAAVTPDAGGNKGGGFLSQVGGFFEGLWEGGKDMVTGLWQAVTNPIDTIKGLAYAVTHPGELWEALKKPYVDDWNSGNYGRAIGRGTFEVLSMLFPPGGGAAAKGVTKGADVAADMGRLASMADKAADLARGADKAADLARASDKAGDAARLIDGVSDGGRGGGAISDLGTLSGKGPEPFMFEAAKEAGRGVELFDSAGKPVQVMDPYFGRAGAVEASKDAALRYVNPATDAATKDALLDDLARLTTHGSGDRVVLGPWNADKIPGRPNWIGEYGIEAQSNGGRYFHSEGIYDIFRGDRSGPPVADIWEVNKRFLEQQFNDPSVKRIDYVLENPSKLFADPDQLALPYAQRRASWKELDALFNRAEDYGFVFDDAQGAWIRP